MLKEIKNVISLKYIEAGRKWRTAEHFRTEPILRVNNLHCPKIKEESDDLLLDDEKSI